MRKAQIAKVSGDSIHLDYKNATTKIQGCVHVCCPGLKGPPEYIWNAQFKSKNQIMAVFSYDMNAHIFQTVILQQEDYLSHVCLHDSQNTY